MPHLVSVVHTLGEQGVGFQSLTEAIHTTTDTDRRGAMVFSLWCCTGGPLPISCNPWVFLVRSAYGRNIL
jgi:hypothetical protein